MFCVYYVMLFYATTSPCSILVGVWSFNSNTRPTGSWCVHILHWSSYNALWNVGLLIRGQSLLYCVNSFKMAVCCGQSPWIHTILSLLLPQSCSDVYPTSLPFGYYEGFQFRRTCSINCGASYGTYWTACVILGSLWRSLFPLSQVSSFLPLPSWWYCGLSAWLYSELLQLCYHGRTSSWNRRVC